MYRVLKIIMIIVRFEVLFKLVDFVVLDNFKQVFITLIRTS